MNAPRPTPVWPNAGASPEAVLDAVTTYAASRGLSLYPHQEEATLALLGGDHVILATPTGSGKSLVAVAAHAAALATDRVSFYTAPIKALVNEKFFELCAIFGADNVGMLTGDASVNADAPIICCTAEVLANLALREGRHADVGLVVMDEFHYYGEPERGWAWQVPLLELPQAQFLLMSATLGDTSEIAADLTRRTGREVSLVNDAERPVPLDFTWSLEPLADTLSELVTTGQGPVYVVHFTQAAAVAHATGLLGSTWIPKPSEELKERLAGVPFGSGFGKTLTQLLKQGIGVHHAGMLPRYRRLVEQLAQAGLLRIVCGTDTLGVGINVPIRTVLFTALAKYDGSRMRVLRTREFLQIAGRAGRAGYDTVGSVVVQAPEHVIENEKAKAKSAAKNAAMSDAQRAKRASKPQLKKAPEGSVVWTEKTFEKLVAGEPEALVSRMKVDHAMLLNVLSREEDAFAVMRHLLMGNHEPRRIQLRLARRALRLTRSLVASGVVTRLDQPDEFDRRYVVTEALPSDFALNQPLSHFALEVLETLDVDAATYALDVLSVIEATLEGPRQILFAQQHAARGEVIAELKADGVDYEERMAEAEKVTWPRPLADVLEPLFEIYRAPHPWLSDDALEPKSIVRMMWEHAMGFNDFVSRYDLARSEGLVLRYITDAYKALVHTVPEAHHTETLDDLIDWLAETIHQIDSSLLDEWQALSDPSHVSAAVAGHAPPPPPRPLSAQPAFTVMLRNALWRRVELVAYDKVRQLADLDRLDAARFDPPREPEMTHARWDAAMEEYFTEHNDVRLEADARGPQFLDITDGVEEGRRIRRVRQTLADPEGHHDWVIDAIVDLDASDLLGEAALTVTDFHRLGG
ncbi:RNA helicase [Nocardioides sp.]|uniref:DEAD/DEAH box helicase n=1 Tax=Nocardioides sp. TaxID=35761 RepID=UPI002605C8D3|nr:DEAD/DEAH box helicase [Nocardioides sp.]